MRLPYVYLVDLLAIIAFVLIGRASHGENLVVGALATLWPFVVGAIVGWFLARGRVLSVWPGGALVWFASVAIGVLLRAATGQGVEPSFVVVTAIVLGVLLIGWRAIARLVLRRRAR